MQTIFNSGANRQPVIPGKTYVRTELVDGSSQIPEKPWKVLMYILIQPQDWILNYDQIQRTLGITNYTVRKSLKWLQNAGYARYERKKAGLPQWFVYDIPQKMDEDIDKTTPRTR